MSSMDFIPFEDRKVSLITYVVNIQGNYDRETIFETFPIKLIAQTKKKKPPFIPDFAGNIISLVFGDSHRGIKRKPFKNTTSITMCLSERNMSVSIFDSKTDSTNFKFAGAKKEEHIYECLSYINKYLLDVQEMLDYIQLNNENCLKVIKWMKENLATSENTLKPIPEIPENIDKKIATYYLSFHPEFTTWSDYETVISWISNVERVVSLGFKEMKVNTIISTMTNYNLGFEVNRAALAKLASEKTKFISIYDNTSKQSCVKLELPYERDETFKNIRKKKKIPKHSISIHKSGNVTQSGPNSVLMKPIYDYFMNIIMEVKHLIMNNPEIEKSKESEIDKSKDSDIDNNLTEEDQTETTVEDEEDDEEEEIGN
jgi:hypothetical protein